jgi:hypothetical protein
LHFAFFRNSTVIDPNTMPVKIINLVSGPRNISTALMYSFAQRSDCQVVDEPFYAVYLKKSGALHPGREEVLSSQSQKEGEVRAQLGRMTGPLLFIKNMAHHMEVLNEPLMKGAVNLFLIRDPLQIITSYSNVIEKPVMRDIGIAYQHQLFKQLTDNGEKPVVVDSGLLLKNPPDFLQRMCEALGIPFDEAMLGWPKGPKVYDGVWARHWYSNVHNSTGFQPVMTGSRALQEGLFPLYEEARHIYEKLVPFSVKA